MLRHSWVGLFFWTQCSFCRPRTCDHNLQSLSETRLSVARNSSVPQWSSRKWFQHSLKPSQNFNKICHKRWAMVLDHAFPWDFWVLSITNISLAEVYILPILLTACIGCLRWPSICPFTATIIYWQRRNHEIYLEYNCLLGSSRFRGQ